MCSEEIGRHPNHSQLPKLNKVTEIPKIAIPLVDKVLDTLGGGSVFSVFDFFSGFTQLTIHPDTIPLTAFCTPNGLYEWPRMPPGAAGTPAWFVSVLKLVTAGLDNILMYLDDAIGPDDCPLHHVATLATFFARLRLHKLKLSPDKSRISAARVDFLGHVILADGVRPNDARVAALARMPMPTGIKQLRSLLGGLSYYRKFLPNMAYHIRPVTALLKKSAAFEFASAMEDTVRTLLAELAAPPILVFPDWDAVIDTSRPLRLRPDGSRQSSRLSHPRVRTHHPFLPHPWRELGWAGPLAGYPSLGWASSLTVYSGLGWATPDISRLPDTPCPATVSLCDYLPSLPSRDLSPGALHNLRH